MVWDCVEKCASGPCVEVLRAADRNASRDKMILSLPLFADSLSPPVNVTITAVKANSAVVTWDIAEGEPVIGFAITQQVSHTRARAALIALMIQQ